MGPTDSSTMSTTDALKLIKLPKLKDDRSNWIMYQERIINTLTHKGLKRHVLGTAWVPDEIEIRNSKSYKKGGIVELTEEQLDSIEKYTDEYEQREAEIADITTKCLNYDKFKKFRNQLGITIS